MTALLRRALALALLVALLAPHGALGKKKRARPADAAPPAAVEPEPVYGPAWPPPPPWAAPSDTEGTLVAAPPVPRAEPFGRGQLLVGAKVGGAFAEPYGLGASFVVGVEVGWVLPRVPVIGRGLAVTLDAAYTQPGAGVDETDARVAANGGNYHVDVALRELSFGLTALYRAPFVWQGRLVPYAGLGPRLFLLSATTGGQAGGGQIAGYSESATRVGLGAPVGADYAIGPGRVFLEALFLYAPIDTNVTGAGSAGAISVAAGYRLLL